jgi:hypothetical protein
LQVNLLEQQRKIHLAPIRHFGSHADELPKGWVRVGGLADEYGAAPVSRAISPDTLRRLKTLSFGSWEERKPASADFFMFY